jgi:hypothetical protein
MVVASRHQIAAASILEGNMNSELGQSAKKAVEFIRDFFDDVAKLLASVDDGMEKQRWLSIHGSQCYWGGSYSVKLGPQWLPHSLHRIYGRAPLPKGNATAVSLVAFFSVYLIPKCSPHTLAVWGFAAQSRREGIYPRFDPLLYTAEGPDFLRERSRRGLEASSYHEIRNLRISFISDNRSR